MMIRSASNGHIPTYICGTRLKRPGGRTCAAPIVRTAEADAAVWNLIQEQLRDPGLPARLAADQAVEDTAHDWKADAAGFRRHIARLGDVESALFVRFRRGSIDADRLDTEIAALNRERDAVKRQLDTAAQAIAAERGHAIQVADARAIVGQLRDVLDSNDVELRRRLAVLLIAAPVVFHGLDAHFELVIPRAKVAVGGAHGSGATGTGGRREDGHQILGRLRLVARQ
jgi:hypothetical protein